jgi:hypothetical protein
MKNLFLLIIASILVTACNTTPKTTQHSNAANYSRYAPSYAVHFGEAPEELNIFQGEERSKSKGSDEIATMVPLATTILSDIGTSILFTYMARFNEIDYINTQEIVPLVDLWFEIEQDFLLKMYSSNVIRAHGSWSVTLRQITREEWNEISDNFDANRRRLWSEFRPAWALFYPILADPLGREELNRRGYTKAFEGTFNMNEFYRGHY